MDLPKMQYSKLGSSGLKVSRICLGCMSYGNPNWAEWVYTEEQAKPFIKRALDLGINFFDTAGVYESLSSNFKDVYSLGASEQVLGNVLKDIGTPRDEVVIATKVFYPTKNKPNSRGLSRKHIMESIDASLQRLKTSYIDIFQIHRWDSETPIEETMEALHDAVRMGKIHYIGASSMQAWQFAKAQYYAKYRGLSTFISMQNHYNLIYREEEREVNPMCADMGVGLIPWSPLARGLLTGSYKQIDSQLHGNSKRSNSDEYVKKIYSQFIEEDWKIIERVEEISKKKKVSPSQIALAWLLQKPQVISPVIGATKLNHIDEAVGALEVKLTLEELKYLEELYVPHHLVH